jgi:hypothetical protein
VVQNLEYSRSDHRPILLTIGDEQTQEVRDHVVLRFEACRLKEKNFHAIVQEAWDASAHQIQSDLAGRLSVVHDSLHRWDRSILKKPHKRIKAIKKILKS